MAQVWEWNEWIRLEAPDDWVVEEEDGVVSLFQPETGCGALQFSVMSYESVPSDVEEHAVGLLTMFANNRNGETKALRSWRTDKYTGAVAVYAEIATTARWWEAWVITDGKRRVLLTYNCETDDKGTERSQYALILRSCSFLWVGGARLLAIPWYWSDLT